MTPSITRPRLDDLLARAAGARIAVIGDAMLDVYLRGEVDRVSPEAPVPVVAVRDRQYALGGAANVAQNVAAVGARCHLVATAGRDPAGAQLRSMLDALGVGHRDVLSIDRCTTQKTRIVARSQQVVRVDEEDDSDLDSAETSAVLAHIRRVVDDADAVVLEDYNKGLLVPGLIAEVMQLARQRKLPVVVDPKYRNFFLYRGATIFKPNRRELEAALGAAVDVEHPETLPTTLERLGVANILLTLGERGMVLFSVDGEIARVPTVARQVYDVVGAGDTVTAYLATMLAAGASAFEAAWVANIAAGIEVGKPGAATVSASEVLEYVSLHDLAAPA
jgi:D-beta-D-heptose 7-phosphate kinase/D-beta-D-heptose 1-phosphate adenosyltransferase